MPNQNPNLKNADGHPKKGIDYLALLKTRRPNLYRHIMAVIKDILKDTRCGGSPD